MTASGRAGLDLSANAMSAKTSAHPYRNQVTPERKLTITIEVAVDRIQLFTLKRTRTMRMRMPIQLTVAEIPTLLLVQLIVAEIPTLKVVTIADIVS